MTILCIYHGKCDDGFGAAWAVYQYFQKKHLNTPHGEPPVVSDYRVEFYPGEYNKAPPDVAGKDVMMVDFSYKRPVIEEMAQTARSILILDHHKTALEELQSFPAVLNSATWEGWISGIENNRHRPAVAALFDMGRSGAGITWDFFHRGAKRPRLIEYIEDRDLWKKQLPRGDEFTINLRSYPQEFTLWDFIASAFEADPDSFLDGGTDIQRYYRVQVEAIKAQGYPAYVAIQNNMPGTSASPARYSGMFANAPYAFASEVAGELIDVPGLEGAEFGACFFERADGRWQYSLRSRTKFDVSRIAKYFGGGGHAQAAGFDVAVPIHTRIGKVKP